MATRDPDRWQYKLIGGVAGLFVEAVAPERFDFHRAKDALARTLRLFAIQAPELGHVGPLICLISDPNSDRRVQWTELARNAEWHGGEFVPFVCAPGDDLRRDLVEPTPAVSGAEVGRIVRTLTWEELRRALARVADADVVDAFYAAKVAGEREAIEHEQRAVDDTAKVAVARGRAIGAESDDGEGARARARGVRQAAARAAMAATESHLLSWWSSRCRTISDEMRVLIPDRGSWS